jgi:ribulose-5-phosphate 4-epimerase/fuculose-1-phosphate aldolase
VSDAASLLALREKVSQSCRILAMMGVVAEITGHVSARVPGTDEMLIRCRGEYEDGVRYTLPEAVRQIDFDGNALKPDDGYDRPLEFPIHGEVLRARPDVQAVVHAHPPAILRCGMAGVDLKPVFGAFDVMGAGMALAGIPVYSRSVLIRDRDLGQAVAAVLGDKHACVLRGHGIVTCGRTVEEATLRALSLERLAGVCWNLSLRGELPDLPPEDLDEWRRATSAPAATLPRAEEWNWRHFMRMLNEGVTPSPLY